MVDDGGHCEEVLDDPLQCIDLPPPMGLILDRVIIFKNLNDKMCFRLFAEKVVWTNIFYHQNFA